jgi:hypothetical protein
MSISNKQQQANRQLWDNLAAEWQPQTNTERYYLEQMSVSQWLLTRTARSESRIYQADLQLEKQIALLDRVSAQRVRLERSSTAGMRELKQLQKERQAQARQQPIQTTHTAKATPAQAPKPAEPQAPPPDYVMSESVEAHPVLRPRHPRHSLANHPPDL